MKKLFGSNWVFAGLAIVLGLGVQAWMLLAEIDVLTAPPPPRAQTEPPRFIDWTFLTPEIDEMRTELSARLEAVGQREEELHDYERRLAAEKAEIEKIKRDIETTRDGLSTRLIEIESSEQKNLKTLAATYSNMSAGAALSIFKEMDDDMVVKILAFMKPDAVGPILEAMAGTTDGDGTLAARAAVLSNKLRLLRQVKAEQNT